MRLDWRDPSRAKHFGFYQPRGANRWAKPLATAAISPLRFRLIDDMNMRRFSRETQRNYNRDFGRLATFLGRSPHTTKADDLRAALRGAARVRRS